MRRTAAIVGILALAVGAFVLARPPARPTADGTGGPNPGATPPGLRAASPTDDSAAAELHAGPAGRGGEARGPIERADGEPVGRPDVALPVRARRHLTLVDAAGRPIAGARIEMLEPEPEEPFDIGLPGPAPATREVRTDAHGRFDVAFEGGGWPSGLRITCPDRAPFLSFVPWRTHEIRVGASVHVRGRVVERGTDRPVVGALVRERPDHGQWGHWNWVRSTTSDADGAFELEIVGPRGLAVDAEGIAIVGSAYVDVRDRDVDGVVLELGPPGARGVVEGRVLLDDRPVAGVRIVLPATVMRTEPVASAPTGADGIYRCEPVFEADSEVEIDATAIGLGTCRAPASFVVRDGRAVHDVVLPPRWILYGTVVRGGVALEGAVVRARSGGSVSTSVSSDASGAFRVVGMFGRREFGSVDATAPDGGDGMAYLPSGDGGSETKGIVIKVASIGHVRGRVVTPSGRPVEGAEVQGGRETRTDAAGRFDLLTSPGRRPVFAFADGFLPSSVWWVDVPAGAAGVVQDVVIRMGGTISGTVSDSDGHALPGASVRVERAEAGGGALTLVETVARFLPESGHFVTADHEGESFRLTVSAPGFVTRVIDGVEPASELPPIVLEHEPATPAPR